MIIPIGMRAKVAAGEFVINTCSDNDTSERGDINRWSWSNPTNRAIKHTYEDVTAVSLEALWQACKLLPGQTKPDQDILDGAWRKNKGKKPVGAYAGGKPLLTTPGAARRAIYIPAFRNLINHWMNDPEVASWVQFVRAYNGNVYLRDFDTGQGLDRNGPMSHAWVLSVWLNTGSWPN